MRYRTREGDMLDAICHGYYKGRPGALEVVLEANPGLARRGAVLPAGIEIELPDPSSLPGAANSKADTIRLWD